jgi:cyclic-di-GMP-binding protein
MATAASFDVTSTVDLQEVDNALNQARKEVAQRYDLKGARTEIAFNPAEKTLVLTAEDRMQVEALWDVVQTRLVRRSVPVKNFKPGEIQPAAGGAMRRTIELQQGISTDAAREIVKFLKDQKLKKVQAAIQSDQVRVSAPSKDDLQEAIRLLRGHDFGIELQFGNYRP